MNVNEQLTTAMPQAREIGIWLGRQVHSGWWLIRWLILLDLGVLVRDFSDKPGLAGCVRVTIGTEEENDWFLRALDKVLR